MSLTINGTTNTLTAASGLTIAGNTAVTGALSFGEGGGGGFLGVPIDTGYMRIHGSNAINQGAGIILFGTTSAAPNTGRLTAAASTIVQWTSTGLAVTGTLSASGITSVTDATDATSTTAASLKTAGGLAVAKKMYIGDNIVMASGKGIDFSATANGSGTTSSEVLSDYEEGTWTATVQGSVTNPTTPVTAVGHYTKIGRMVTAIFDISSFDTTGAAGNIQIAGLPFTSLAADPRNLGDMYFSRSSAACMAFLEPGSTTLTAVDSNGNAVTHGSVGAGTFAAASITYFV